MLVIALTNSCCNNNTLVDIILRYKHKIMKFLIVGRQYPDSFAKNIKLTLEAMGHSVAVYQENQLFPRLLPQNSIGSSMHLRYLEEQLIKCFRPIETLSYRRLIELADHFKPECILVTYHHVPPAVIKTIKNTINTKIVLWYPDSLANFDRQYFLLSDFDNMFFKDTYIINLLLNKTNLKVNYLPECCNPRWHNRVNLSGSDQSKYSCDIGFAGSMYPYRVKILEQFAGYDFKIWGDRLPFWLDSKLRNKFQNTYVAEINKAKAFNAAKIILNTIHYSEINGVNCRVFEIAGCGGFQIVDKKPALRELFEEGTEIVTFETKEELKCKVDYYLSHETERSTIAEAAYKRAQRDHTYEKRLNTMFNIIF